MDYGCVVSKPFTIVGTSSCCKERTFGRVCSCLDIRRSGRGCRCTVMKCRLGGALARGKDITENIYSVSNSKGLIDMARRAAVMGHKRGTTCARSSKGDCASLTKSAVISVGL